MAHHESVAIAFGIVCAALYIASCVLSIAFLLMPRGSRWRWLPCVSVIALPLIEIAPESGWSDVRSQWHQAALGVVWSLWALFLVFGVLSKGKGRVLNWLRGVLRAMGVFGLAGSTVVLLECWTFPHGL
jgi:hypothetical protein